MAKGANMFKKILGFLTALLILAPYSHGKTIEVYSSKIELEDSFLDSLSEDQKTYLLEQLGKQQVTFDVGNDEVYKFIDMDEIEKVASSSDSILTHPERK
jgi:hypothetical protein